jgi:hypothetical protein
MNKIYESPDGGKTVYVRDFGSSNRTLSSNGYLPGSVEDKIKKLAKTHNEQQWVEILHAAETNTVLAEMLVQVKLLYLLSKDDENISTQT